MDFVIYAGRINRYIEREHIRELEGRLLEYETVREFLADIKKEFGKGDKNLVKVAELKKLE